MPRIDVWFRPAGLVFSVALRSFVLNVLAPVSHGKFPYRTSGIILHHAYCCHRVPQMICVGCTIYGHASIVRIHVGNSYHVRKAAGRGHAEGIDCELRLGGTVARARLARYARAPRTPPVYDVTTVCTNKAPLEWLKYGEYDYIR